MTAVLVGLCVGLATLAVRRPDTATAIASYVGDDSGVTERRRARTPRLLPGLLIGGITGAALLPLPWAAATVSGSAAGAFAQYVGARRTERRWARRLGQELPAVADLLALYILSGESVIGSMRHLASEASGVAAAEIDRVLLAVDGGQAVYEALREAARDSAHVDGGRLFELLGQAHRSGARLVDALEIFAADRRSAIEQAIVEEGGRRALTGYGPILGLMIPTTLVFLMYPTLAGLDALAASP